MTGVQTCALPISRNQRWPSTPGAAPRLSCQNACRRRSTFNSVYKLLNVAVRSRSARSVMRFSRASTGGLPLCAGDGLTEPRVSFQGDSNSLLSWQPMDFTHVTKLDNEKPSLHGHYPALILPLIEQNTAVLFGHPTPRKSFAFLASAARWAYSSPS